MTRRSLRLFAAFILLLPSGFADASPPPSPLEPLTDLDSSSLCMLFHTEPGDAVRNEIDHRKLVSESDWPVIDVHDVKKGMSLCALLAAKGPPTTIVRTHEPEADLSTDQRRDVIYIYGRDGATLYYMIDKGLVTRISAGIQ